MSFLQPWLLWTLPIAGLPILIHLINQRRYRTVEWGAMQFLLSANRMSRGYARIRQWLIMAMRVLAIAGLIMAISRPLSSGWLGLTAGGRADTTVVLLDRSPSMQRRVDGVSGIDSARRQLADVLATLGSNRYVLIDSATAEAQEMESPTALLESPAATGVSASADLPAMLQTLHDYIKDNSPGRTEVWIASDLQENDWQSEDGRWASLRDAFVEFPQEVRFHLLNYSPQTSPAAVSAARPNLSIRVTEARRVLVDNQPELLVSVVVTRDATGVDELPPISLPLQFEIDGSRTQMRIDLTGGSFELKDHRIPLAADAVRGWGRVSLPADVNPADDGAYFVFDEPPLRRTIIVSDNPDAVRPLQLAASIAPDAAPSEAEVLSPDTLQTLAWEELALVVWAAEIPAGKTAEQLTDFVARGGQLLFLPPESPGGESFLGVRWEAWRQEPRPLTPDNWRSDQDLLQKTASGASLPVGRWQVQRYCSLAGEFNTLASLPGGAPLLARVITEAGGVYFLATTTEPDASSLGADGVVLYVFTQRAIEVGLGVLGDTRSQPAGPALPAVVDPWRRLAGDTAPAGEEVLSTDYQYHQGVYVAGDKLVALNRVLGEDTPLQVADDQIGRLFAGLDFDQVDTQPGSDANLVQEVWRLFLGAMMIALTVEAGLCLPRVVKPSQEFVLSPRPAAAAPERSLEEVA
ncbi:hypothetical protein Pla123a_19320 [Posidoniimonas polymericola]|uniref:Aerotolerance regulator N-terminal domain-containing protein n=1 Tax=Posidoniimonas polymericola TaxID=2528002 RepID=A0A5C5YQT0_9BACT|nr:BatA domain-containing protein [Posidoniimonas polymericola]TWT77275.1 hypothetical protein Pla123a_19320 [Posidoniimonas polymericola]